MPSDNLTIVQEMFERYVDGDADAWWGRVHEDFEFHLSGAFVEDNIVVGVPAYQAYAGRAADAWPDLEYIDPVFQAAPGGEVLFTVTLSGGVGTDNRVLHRVAYVMVVKGEHLYRMFEHINPAAAKRAVGLAS
ncbi:hypothetical protein AWB85_17990 [Mycobacteroides immunogenum]|uniref:SnoaL-like domain-containing protein n=1 Tax=Mycobacteroides immunogenum TaxID=83262 RepID=A0A179V3T3_9MYCO|nr:nuclear transport factor 2 family protein [Mycobacteroides immunogenum]OAT66589.1 hypothetical protein AWB85_17990 [Mycobacteroides immunogenum]